MPTIPKELPSSPLSVMCPRCSAKPGKACIMFKNEEAVHIERIEALAAQDEENRK